MNALGFRSLQGLFAVSAVVLLTGAKGEGCGRVVVEEPPSAPSPPAQPACSAGWHMGSVCSTPVAYGAPVPVSDAPKSVDGSDQNPAIGAVEPSQPPPQACHDECVPDGPCPDGQAQQWACSATGGVDVPSSPPESGADPVGRGEPGMPVCQGADCPPPPSCQLVCVPAACPQGSHAEWSCAGGVAFGSSGGSAPSEPPAEPGAPALDDAQPAAPPHPTPGAPSDCAMSCVADSRCPAGYEEMTECSAQACAAGQDCPPSTPSCITQCVPQGGSEPSQPSSPPTDAKPL